MFPLLTRIVRNLRRPIVVMLEDFLLNIIEGT